MNNVKRYIKIIALFSIGLIIFFSLPSLCYGHDAYDEHHHHDDDHNHESPSYKYSKEANMQFAESPNVPKKLESVSSLWIEALSATLIISIAPFFILFFVPVNSRHEGGSLLKIMLSFAAGGLLGDAFLHLIPHALEPHAPGVEHSHAHDHGHSHGGEISLITGLWILSGLFIFFILDKGMRWLKSTHNHACTHGDEHTDETDQKEEKEVEVDDEKKKEIDNSDAISESDDEIEVAGYLNLVADFAHNFTDGLAIGASFMAGRKVGLVTTFSIFCHEIPHEIGDFAILVQSGCSKKKAMLLQLITAFGALCGTLVSLVTGGSDVGATSSVLPFTAGGFIYIALVSIMPEILKESSFRHSLYEIGALLLGVFIMIIVAQFE